MFAALYRGEPAKNANRRNGEQVASRAEATNEGILTWRRFVLGISPFDVERAAHFSERRLKSVRKRPEPTVDLAICIFWCEPELRWRRAEPEDEAVANGEAGGNRRESVCERAEEGNTPRTRMRQIHLQARGINEHRVRRETVQRALPYLSKRIAHLQSPSRWIGTKFPPTSKP